LSGFNLENYNAQRLLDEAGRAQQSVFPAMPNRLSGLLGGDSARTPSGAGVLTQ
jgi:hypothetical protein